MGALTIPAGFLIDDTAALIGCDWLQERGVPLADVLLWYAHREEPEGPPTVLVGEYGGRVTGDWGRAERVCRHQVRASTGASRGLWFLLYPPDCSLGDAGRGLAFIRRELRRRVLGLFPEVVIRNSFFVDVSGCRTQDDFNAALAVARERMRAEGWAEHAETSVEYDGSVVAFGGPTTRIRYSQVWRAPDLVPPLPPG
jgi:hypothetical protein